MKWIAWLGLAAFSIAAPVLAAQASSDSRNGVAIVFPPWIDEGGAMARVAESGGATLRAGAFGFIPVAIPLSPDFHARVRANGALLFLDPAFLGGCFDS